MTMFQIPREVIYHVSQNRARTARETWQAEGFAQLGTIGDESFRPAIEAVLGCLSAA